MVIMATGTGSKFANAMAKIFTPLDKRSGVAHIPLMKRLILFLCCLCWAIVAYGAQAATVQASNRTPVPIALDDDECGNDEPPPDGGE